METSEKDRDRSKLRDSIHDSVTSKRGYEDSDDEIQSSNLSKKMKTPVCENRIDNSCDSSIGSNSAFEADDSGWKHISDRRRRPNRSFRLPEPTFFTYPVIIEDLKTGTDTYGNYGAGTNEVWKLNRCGAIVSQRRCKTQNKWMIECSTFGQQQSIAQMKSIKTKKGTIDIKAEIPVATTEGVIGPLNREWSDETIMNLIQESSTLPIKKIQRLKKDGENCSAVKIVFLTNVLPESIKVGTQYFCVEPFRKTIIRCLKCQKLDHIAAMCPKKDPRCPRGCPKAHINGVRECPRVKTEDWLCINCNSRGHSAAYAGCPARKRLQQAHELRAKKYMPLGVAIKACATPVPQINPRRRSSTPENAERATLALNKDPLSSRLTWAQRAAGLDRVTSHPVPLTHPQKSTNPSQTSQPPSSQSNPHPCNTSMSGPPTGASRSSSAAASAGINLRPGGSKSGSTISWKLGAGTGAGVSKSNINTTSPSSNQVFDNLMTLMTERLDKLEEKSRY